MDRVFETMRRLHARGPASRGVVVDAEGAMVGPDCVLVRRCGTGYRSLRREDASAIQKSLAFEKEDDPDRLYVLSRGIAEALNQGELALAQIYGLRIPITGLDSPQIAQLPVAARFAKANFNPDEPRDERGRWTDEGGDRDRRGAALEDDGSSASGSENAMGNDRHLPSLPADRIAPIRQDVFHPLLQPASEVTFGHGSRHVDDPGAIEAAIKDALSMTPLLPGFNSGAVHVGGAWYIYRAFLHSDGRIHMGTYYPW